MRLLLQRHASGPTSTIGELCEVTTAGKSDRWCYTCEDVVREVIGQPVRQWKVPGQTAIPSGVYRVVLSQSQRFGRILPELLNVPGFTGIRIHPGNTPQDTAGCLLPGFATDGTTVSESRAACAMVLDRLDACDREGDRVYLEVRNAAP